MTETTTIAAPPRVYLETYGCQMNIADSQTVTAVLRRAGYLAAERPEEADVILINTCAIREHAEERVIGRLSDLARLKQVHPALKLGLLGCMAQHNRALLIERAPWLDVVAGPDTYRRLPELLGRQGAGESEPGLRLADSATHRSRGQSRGAGESASSGQNKVFDPAIDVRLDRAETYADIAPEYAQGVRAYVTAMRGCDRFCTFCVVPYVRGRERSVPPDAILREVRALAARGVKEVVLLGQTVNAYRHDNRDDTTDFGGLLRLVAAVDGIERIRFTSPHPCDMIDSVIDAMAAEPKVQPYLHLPVQSGSDRVLAAMERGYTSAEYLDLVARLRRAIPELALSTDIIVGFHGEDESDFIATLDLMRTVGYDSAFTFKYSVREHTRAHKLGDSVSEAEKGRRLAEVIGLQERIALDRNRALIGRDFPVLIEGPARRGAGMLAGKTPQFKTAVFPTVAGRAAGETVAVRIISATGHSLIGQAV